MAFRNWKESVRAAVTWVISVIWRLQKTCWFVFIFPRCVRESGTLVWYVCDWVDFASTTIKITQPSLASPKLSSKQVSTFFLDFSSRNLLTDGLWPFHVKAVYSDSACSIEGGVPVEFDNVSFIPSPPLVPVGWKPCDLEFKAVLWVETQRKGQNEKRHRRDDGGGADHRDDRRSLDTYPGKTGLLTACHALAQSRPTTILFVQIYAITNWGQIRTKLSNFVLKNLLCQMPVQVYFNCFSFKTHVKCQERWVKKRCQLFWSWCKLEFFH